MQTAVLLGGYQETGWKADRLKQLSKWLFVAPHVPHFGEIIKYIIRTPATHKLFVASAEWLKIAVAYTQYKTDAAWVRNLAKMTDEITNQAMQVSSADVWLYVWFNLKSAFNNWNWCATKVELLGFFAVGYASIALAMFSALGLLLWMWDAEMQLVSFHFFSFYFIIGSVWLPLFWQM